MQIKLRLMSRSFLTACLLAGCAAYADGPAAVLPPPKMATTTTAPTTQAVKEAADIGAVKMGRDQGKGFLGRHEGFLKDLAALNGKCDILFVGDSITDGWRGKPNPDTGKGGAEVFAKNYGDLSPYNIGIGGDRTQHVIWRLEHGEVEGIKPKVAVLMIGTNNLGGNTNDEIVSGITKIVGLLHEKLPTTKVLLLGIFPRGKMATDPNRDRIKDINAKIAKLDDGGKTVKYLDIGPKFLTEDGTLPKEIMPDALHPNTHGYEIWAEATKPALDELMK